MHGEEKVHTESSDVHTIGTGEAVALAVEFRHNSVQFSCPHISQFPTMQSSLGKT